MNLYFLNADNEEILVKENVKAKAEDIRDAAMHDLETRMPDFNSFYQRCWWDDHRRFWIDFGSHTEFYICHEPYDHKCNEDFCELDL